MTLDRTVNYVDYALFCCSCTHTQSVGHVICDWLFVCCFANQILWKIYHFYICRKEEKKNVLCDNDFGGMPICWRASLVDIFFFSLFEWRELSLELSLCNFRFFSFSFVILCAQQLDQINLPVVNYHKFSASVEHVLAHLAHAYATWCITHKATWKHFLFWHAKFRLLNRLLVFLVTDAIAESNYASCRWVQYFQLFQSVFCEFPSVFVFDFSLSR